MSFSRAAKPWTDRHRGCSASGCTPTRKTPARRWFSVPAPTPYRPPGGGTPWSCGRTAPVSGMAAARTTAGRRFQAGGRIWETGKRGSRSPGPGAVLARAGSTRGPRTGLSLTSKRSVTQMTCSPEFGLKNSGPITGEQFSSMCWHASRLPSGRSVPWISRQADRARRIPLSPRRRAGRC